MIRYKQSVHGLQTFFNEFAELLNVTPSEGRITIPPNIGTGYLQLETLPNSLTALILDYKLNVSFFYERSSSQNELYTLRTRESNIDDYILTKIGDEKVKETGDSQKKIFLTASFFDLHQFFSAGTQTSAVFIEFTREWLARFFKMETYDDVLREYLSLKVKMMNAVIMDADYSKAHHEILELNREHPAERAVLHNRIMYIIERFFNDLYEKRTQIKYRIKTKNEDIKQVMQAEQEIMKDLAKFPGINVLAKKTGMSASKLKVLFSKIYGMPMHEYFQMHRLQKAKALIIDNESSVKEAGYEVGFKNLSNFSAAFKKQFGITPNELKEKNNFQGF